MGAAMGIDSNTMPRCLEVTKEVIKTFTVEYSKGFVVALVKKIKADANPQPGPQERLLVKNVNPDEPLKEGWAIKEGEIRKNWKKRYFYVTPDFRMLYFADDKACEEWKEKNPKLREAKQAHQADKENDELKKAFQEAKKDMKKCMPLKEANLYSYSTYTSNKKEHCLELYHWRKRKFYVQFENEEERKDWRPILQTCCRKAKQPINPNPVQAAAFNAAYDRTRWRNSIWGWWYWDSPEAELIGALAFDVCRRTVLADVYSSMRGGYSAKQKLDDAIKKQIQAAVAPAWIACQEAVQKLQETIEPELKKGLDPIFEAERDLKLKISDMVSDKIGPAVGEVVDPIVQKLLIEICSKPIHEGWLALNGAIEELYKHFCGSINGKGAVITKNEFRSSYRSTQYKCRYFHSWWSVTRPISEKLDEMREELKIVADLVQGLDGYNVYYTISEQYHNIVLDGLFTWQQAIHDDFDGEEMPKDKFEALAKAKWLETVPKIAHDSQVVYEEQISWLLEEAIKGPFIRLIMKGVGALLEPLDELIPGPVKQFISATGTAEDVITQSIDNILEKSVKLAVEEKKAELQADIDAKKWE